MINKHEFDLELMAKPFIISEEIDDLKYFHASLKFHMKKTGVLKLVCNEGSGAFMIAGEFQKKFIQQFLILECHSKTTMDLLEEILLFYKFNNTYLRIEDTTPEYIVEGLMYYLHEMNNRPLLLFRNFSSLRKNEMEILLPLVHKLALLAGIIIHIEVKKDSPLGNHTSAIIKNNIQKMINIVVLKDLTVEDLKIVCMKSGITNAKLIKDLTQHQPALEVLLFNIDTFRDELAAKKFITLDEKREKSNA